MVKAVAVLLIVAAVLVMAIAGASQPGAAAERDFAPSAETSIYPPRSEPISELAPASQWHRNFWSPRSASIRYVNSAPASRVSIASLLFEHTPKPCWLSLAPSQGQGLTLNRISSDNKFNQSGYHKLVRRYRQWQPEVPSVFSRHLQESSPPGFFLLV